MKNKYCLGEFLSNIFAYILTKLFYRPARLIRRPLYLRGKKSISIGKGMTIGHACRFDLDGRKKTLIIGENCEFGDGTHIVALREVVFGDNVLVASKVFVSDTNHGSYKGEHQDAPDTAPNERRLVSQPVRIGNNVWIGENAVVLAGSVIGDGCIVGANSLVNGVFGNNLMICGTPAKVVKAYNDRTRMWEAVE